MNSGGNVLRYATESDGPWVLYDLDFRTNAWAQPTIIVTESGERHVVYGAEQALYYAVFP
jgi:hypothetical protein